MSEMYRVTYSDSLAHKQSHASYPGGFIKKNGRMNNSPAYNHAYYDDNKDKWPEYPSQQYKPMGNGKPSNIPPKADKKTGSSTSTSNANSNKPALSPLQQKARDEKLKYQNALKEKNLKDKAAKEAAAKAEAEKKAKQAATAASGSGKKGSSGGKGKGKSSSKTSEEKTTDSAKKEKTSKAAEKAKKEKSTKAETKSADNSESTTKLTEKKNDPIDEDETLSEREKKMYKGIQNVAEKSGQSIATYLQNENVDSIISQYFPGEIDPDEKKVIKKKLLDRYKLEHGEASIGEYYAVRYSNSLAHHGIKGMHWGIRRFQNKDGSLKPAGRKRYGKITQYLIDSKTDYYKERYKMSNKEAKEAAKKRAEFIKKAAIVAGITVGAAAAIYTANYIGRNYFDTVIKAGTSIQTVHNDANRLNSGQAFYTAHKGFDKIKYVGMFGREAGSVDNKYKIAAKASKDIKIASSKNAEKVFNNLVNTDADFRNKLRGRFDLQKTMDLTGANEYEKFNKWDILRSPTDATSKELTDKFYKELSKRGYQGVADVNDRKFSGFNTVASVIFDNDNLEKSSSGLVKTKVTQLKDSEIARDKVAAGAAMVADLMSKPANALTTGSIGVGTAGYIYDRKYDKEYWNKKNSGSKT